MADSDRLANMLYAMLFYEESFFALFFLFDM